MTWFSISFNNSSYTGDEYRIKKGATWSSGVSTTSEELIDAFRNGLVRARITDGTGDNAFGTLNGITHFVECGNTTDAFAFTVNQAKTAIITFVTSGIVPF